MPYDPASLLPPATRAAGLERLQGFLPRAGADYARRRAVDQGADRRTAVSGLSPYIRHRLLTEEEVVEAAVIHHGPDAAEQFIKEVLWRTYWKGWLEMRPAVWDRYRRAVARLAEDRPLMARLEEAAEGRTGIAAFDAWMQELAQTGYLHNHARMSAASIWIFTLKLPWELGADLFLRRLLDGDAASNTLSWRWVAGLHTPGKTYLARPEIIEACSEGRFRPVGLAEAAEAVFEAASVPPPAPLADADVVDPGLPSVVLLHDDDLSPRPLLPDGLDVRACAALSCAAARSPLPVSPAVRSFTQAALGNALDRCNSLGRYLPRQAAAVVAWAREHGAAQVVTPYAPVGPVRDVLDGVAPALDASGIRLVRPRRDWDTALWPLATRGFFAFWKEARPRVT